MFVRVTMLLAVVAGALLGPAGQTQATTGIRVLGEAAVENQFPDALVFRLEAESDAEITDVRLRFMFIPDNLPATARPEFDKGTRISATYTMRSGTRQLYIPPGKTLRYSWELRDAAGGELRTEERETTFADTRFPWEQVSDGNVTVYWYRGGRRDAEVMAQVARETIDAAAGLMGARLDFPIKVWAYASQRDFQIALAHSSVTHDPNVLGQAHDPDTFIMVVDRLSSPTALDTARHELVHLVTAAALRGGPFKELYPAWLNEGTSVYLQVSPNDVGYIDALEAAVRDDKVIPVRLLTSGTRARDIGLFYGESYSLVKYLIDTYGRPKFAQMMAEFKVNGDVDSTFEKVFGVNRDQLDRDWRKSVGLAPERAGGSAPEAEQARPATSDAGSTTAILIGAASVMMVLLLGAAVGGGLLLARRMQHHDGAGE